MTQVIGVLNSTGRDQAFFEIPAYDTDGSIFERYFEIRRVEAGEFKAYAYDILDEEFFENSDRKIRRVVDEYIVGYPA